MCACYGVTETMAIKKHKFRVGTLTTKNNSDKHKKTSRARAAWDGDMGMGWCKDGETSPFVSLANRKKKKVGRRA